jgi:VanZ family protein
MQRPTMAFLDHAIFHWLQIALLAAAVGWAGWETVHGRFVEALAMAAVAGLGVVLLAAPARFAALFRLVLLAAAMVNAVGYLLDLWEARGPFDELVHAFTSFAGCAGISWLLLGRTDLVSGRAPGRLVGVTVAIGVVVGIAWEVFEWLVGIIGERDDTVSDLVMDAIGALLAGLFCAWVAGRRRRTGA